MSKINKLKLKTLKLEIVKMALPMVETLASKAMDVASKSEETWAKTQMASQKTQADFLLGLADKENGTAVLTHLEAMADKGFDFGAKMVDAGERLVDKAMDYAHSESTKELKIRKLRARAEFERAQTQNKKVDMQKSRMNERLQSALDQNARLQSMVEVLGNQVADDTSDKVAKPKRK